VEKIKIDDNLFSHALYSTDIQMSKYINWDRSIIIGNEEIAVYTDQSLSRVNGGVKNKIAWLLESPSITSYAHEWIKNNHHLFDIIFTNNKELLDIGNKFKFVPTCGCWIKPQDQLIYQKSKMLSMITSSKNFTKGHNLRHDVINNIKNIDLYGRGINPIDYKLQGLKDYMFSIVIENTKKDYYFTEKLIDCFATGTIPIYWGCPSIGEYFDDRGMLIFDNFEDLNKIVCGISEELYNLKLEYVRKNFNLSKEYLIAEDYMYDTYLKK